MPATPRRSCAPIATKVPTARQAETLSRQFAALSDPVRLRLVSLLATAEAGATAACDLVAPLGKSQPTVSHHLKILLDAGLVTAVRQGRHVWYAADPTALERLRSTLGVEPVIASRG